MKKTLLLVAAVLFFARCNNQKEEKSEPGHVANDTFAQSLMAPFNSNPQAKEFYLDVQPKEEREPRVQLNVIRNLLAAQRAQPQHFTINSIDLNELQGEYGTRVSFAQSSFVTESGQQVSAPVDIELKECYTKEEMLQENLTTSSNGKLLETKGAVHISAKCNGEEVHLKDGEEIKVQFPFSMGGGYSFYYGDRNGDNMNWTPTVPTEEEMTAAVSKTRVTQPEFSYKGYNLNDYLISQLSYPEDAKRNELSANVDATFTVDKNGKVQNVSCASSYKTFRDEIIYTLEQMPRWKPASYGKKKISSQVKVSIDFNLRRKTQIVVAFNSDDVVPLITDKTRNKQQEGAVMSSTCTTERMGWIACSRVTEQEGPRADVVVRSDAGTDVKLVYRNQMSIAGGANFVGYTRFSNLPIGAEVFVVAVRSQNGETFYAVEPMRLEKQTVVSLNWKKGDKAAIEQLYRGVS
jgi:hypothetical protein